MIVIFSRTRQKTKTSYRRGCSNDDDLQLNDTSITTTSCYYYKNNNSYNHHFRIICILIIVTLIIMMILSSTSRSTIIRIHSCTGWIVTPLIIRTSRTRTTTTTHTFRKRRNHSIVTVNNRYNTAMIPLNNNNNKYYYNFSILSARNPKRIQLYSSFNSSNNHNTDDTNDPTKGSPVVATSTDDTCISSSVLHNNNSIPTTILQISNVISSTQSNTVKRVQSLLKHRNKRMEYQQVIVEGPRMIMDLFRHTITRQYISIILIDSTLCDQYIHELQQILLSVSSSSSSSEHSNHPNNNDGNNNIITIHPTDRKVLESCCTDTVTQQGIVAICNIPTYYNNNKNQRGTLSLVAPTTSTQLPLPPRNMYLVCDGIQDPGNIGTLIRTAVACDVCAILLLPKNCDIWNPKALRSSMGTTFHIPIIEMKHWDECYHYLQTIGGCTSSTIYAATMLDDSTTNSDTNGLLYRPSPSKAYFDVNWVDSTIPQQQQHSTTDENSNMNDDDNNNNYFTTSQKSIATGSALIIGSEGNGLSNEVRDAIYNTNNNNNILPIQTVHVPMIPTVESLNAAICGSIILFEYVRQKILYHQKHTNK